MTDVEGSAKEIDFFPSSLAGARDEGTFARHFAALASWRAMTAYAKPLATETDNLRRPRIIIQSAPAAITWDGWLARLQFAA
jgi:hypothetical protein